MHMWHHFCVCAWYHVHVVPCCLLLQLHSMAHCCTEAVAMLIHSLAHDQCRSCGVVLGPLHLPHQLEVRRDSRTAATRPLEVVEHHHIEGIGMILRGEGGWHRSIQWLVPLAPKCVHELVWCTVHLWCVCVCVCVCVYVCVCVCVCVVCSSPCFVFVAGPHSEGHSQVVLIVAGLLCFVIKANFDIPKCLWLTCFKWPKLRTHFLWQVKMVKELSMFINHSSE